MVQIFKSVRTKEKGVEMSTFMIVCLMLLLLVAVWLYAKKKIEKEDLIYFFNFVENHISNLKDRDGMNGLEKQEAVTKLLEKTSIPKIKKMVNKAIKKNGGIAETVNKVYNVAKVGKGVFAGIKMFGKFF